MQKGRKKRIRGIQEERAKKVEAAMVNTLAEAHLAEASLGT